MRFYADLHLHSKYSRAVSRYADFTTLSLWALKKGITLLATSDFTHPKWFQEIRDNLIPAPEEGLFRLKKEIDQKIHQELPPTCQGSVRYMLGVEVSLTYKTDLKTRKLHHLVFVSDLKAADKLTQRLGRYGNLDEDGRPLLRIGSRNLMEIVLESGDGSFLIPAHIWTPWFGILGSKTGFDSIDECFGDLKDEIFAVETGLSADPDMCRRVSFLDRFSIVSFSDAHSPEKLGREATLFDTDLSYSAVLKALKTGHGLSGTVEFFPEEGKYHYDGHRVCGVCLAPEQSTKLADRCPVCKRKLTIGVLHRVEDLADRKRPLHRAHYRNLLPLVEILSETEGVGPQSKKVRRRYEDIITHLGPELEILDRLPDHSLRRYDPRLAQGIKKIREGDVTTKPGYDGEYGTIQIFQREEQPGLFY